MLSWNPFVEEFIIMDIFVYSKRAHHSTLLHPHEVSKVHDLLRSKTISLARRIFCIPSPYRNICIRFLTLYIVSHKHLLALFLVLYILGGFPYLFHAGTSHRETDGGLPLVMGTGCGLADTLRFLIHSIDYRICGSMEYELVVR